MGVQRREEAKAAIPEPQPAAEEVLSQRKIKTLSLTPDSSKTWQDNHAKVLIPKDRPWEGGYHQCQPVNTRPQKKPKKPSF